MRAVILAGGKGRRLNPYTITFPKPMVPIDDMPILEIVIRQLKMAGLELLMAYFNDGAKWGVTIDYSRETEPLGTVGPLLLVKDLPDNFIVMNGDVLTTLNYRELYEYHLRSNADVSIACHRCNTKIDLGVIEFDGRMQVTGYREKPTLPYDVSMGIYVFKRNVLDLVAPNTFVDFPTIVQHLIDRRRTVRVYLSDNEWLDIGRPDDYAMASKRFGELREQFLFSDPNFCSPREAAE